MDSSVARETKTRLYRALTLLSGKPGQSIFKFQDFGDAFYIIITGEVEILIPAPVQLTGKSNTPEGLLLYLVHNFKEIYWDDIMNGAQFRQSILDRLRDLGVAVDKHGAFDVEKCLQRVNMTQNKLVEDLVDFVWQKLGGKNHSSVSISKFN